MTEPILVVAWLVFAHLVADFVLQNDWIAMNKGRGGGRGWAALFVHGGHVGLCLLPAVFAFGLPGLTYVVVVVASHIAVDSWKVRATRQAEARGQDLARRRLEVTGTAEIASLGAAWTPMPGLLFLADQLFHLTFAIVGWLVILAGATLSDPFVNAANAVFRDWDRAAVHAAILTGVVLLSLLITNTRGAYFFVLALASPRHLVSVPPAPPAMASNLPGGAALRISTSIDTLERLVVVVLVLAGAPIVIGFVIVADLLARARQLEDHAYAEYHLLSLLASLAVALASALLAQAVLHTLG